MTTNSDITLIEEAIHNPNEPRHFMEVVPAGRTITASAGSTPVASSAGALIVKEIGRHVYDPVVYFPRADIAEGTLAKIDKTTHCPLKGDTEYYDVIAGADRHGAAAWSYVDTLDVAEVLRGYVAFDATQVTIE